jgi:hypothetical protein
MSTRSDQTQPELSKDKIWPFNEAPRYLRVKAVDKLPDLIEAMVAATDATAERLRKKVEPARELATAVNALMNPKKKQ